jgi:gamma-glutamyltranspeptidase/glutathione hydrolase
LTPVSVIDRARHDVKAEPGNGVLAFGGAQLVLKQQGGYIAGSDPRKDGQAAYQKQ